MAQETPKSGPKINAVPMDQELALHMLDNATTIFEQYLLVRAELERKQKESATKLAPAELGRTYRENFKRKDRPSKYNFDLACVSALLQKYPQIQSREELENIARMYTQNAEKQLEQPIEDIRNPAHSQTQKVLQPATTEPVNSPATPAEQTEKDLAEWVMQELTKPDEDENSGPAPRN